LGHEGLSVENKWNFKGLMVQAAFLGRLKISAYQFLVSIRLIELRGGTVQQRLFVIFIIIINIKRKQQYTVFSAIAEQAFLVALL
jgi:hypothetical protein